jgi:pterin-4a-carbinolamine dehydratase
MNKLPCLKLMNSSRLACWKSCTWDYFVNYPAYCAKRDAKLETKYERQNLGYIFDREQIKNNHKSIAMRNWKFTEEPGRSFLIRELPFSSREEALQFMNLVTDKCDEIDHHPEWEVKDQLLQIRLTSHFLKNNVSDKDWELAAIISQKYEDRYFYKFAFDKWYQAFIRNFVALLFTCFSVYTLSQFYHLYRNYNITSRDFFFPRILTSENDYNHERRYRNK